VVDAHDNDLMVLLDAVENAVGSAPRGEDAAEVSAQGFAHPPGILDERARQANSTTAVDAASGSLVWIARTAGGVRTIA